MKLNNTCPGKNQKTNEITIYIRDLRRFEFESDGLNDWLEIFESAAPAIVGLPQTTLTVRQKKLQPLRQRRCNWDLFYVYDFMIRHLGYVAKKSIHTR